MMIVLILSILAGGVIVAVVALAALFGWGGAMTWPQRLGLTMTAAGMIAAAPDRFLQRPVGIFDLVLMAGLALYLVATYGPSIARRADAFDGRQDGRVRLPWAQK